MKISLIEMHFHFDSVDGFCKIFENSSHELQVFTLPWIFNHLKNESYIPKYSWHLSDSQNLSKFFKKNAGIINEADFIFINTIAWQYGAYYNAGFTKPVIVRVHNAHKLFDPWRNIRIKLTPYYIWKATSYFVREMVFRSFWYYRPKLIQQTDFFIFPDEGITRYILEKHYLDPAKMLSPLPLKVFEEKMLTAGQPGTSQIRISIIGGIDERRRDYSVIIDAFKLLVPNLSKHLTLTLLGKPNGKYASKVIEQLKALESAFFNLEYYEGPVDQAEFDRKMISTQIILSPIKTETTAEIFREIYGKTKITGSILDMIRFPRITLIPSNYYPGDDFKDLTQQFNDANHLSEIIRNFLNHEAELKKKNEEIMDKISKDYTARSIEKAFITEINSRLRKRHEQV